MSFNIANLVYVDQAYESTPVIWRYSTSDMLSTVEGTGPHYFADAVGMLRTGDIIGVTAYDGKKLYDIGDPAVTLQYRATVSSFSWD